MLLVGVFASVTLFITSLPSMWRYGTPYWSF